MLKILKVGTFGGLLLVAVLGLSQIPHQQPVDLSPVPLVAEAHSAAAADQAANIRASFADVIEKATRSVVSISSSRTVKVSDEENALRRFFGDMLPNMTPPSGRVEHALGSGVIVSEDGLVVTNHHVVGGAQDIEVTLHSGQTVKAKLLGSDAKSDLALLKIEASGLEALPLSDSASVRVGDLVFAIGNPFGVGQTVTMGIVSATGRGGLGIEDYEDFIQTDAAINPGNSGGALIDSNGYLIGINTAIVGSSGGNEGIGFAIPSNMAAHNVDQLRRFGRVKRGLLGAVIQDLTPELAKAFDVPNTQGVLISDVTQGGPAETSGVERGDVVVSLDGKPVPDARRLRLWISSTAPGTTVKLSLLRKGTPMDIDVTLASLEPDETETTARSESNDRGQYGFALQELTPELREQLKVQEPGGVVVSQVMPGSPAEEAGLRRGDVILEVNRVPVSNIAELKANLDKSGSSALLLVSRGGQTSFAIVKRGE